jgi:hypothetical protein
MIYWKRYFYRKKFSVGIGLILAGTILSIVSAYLFHHQSPALTVWAQKGLFFYLFYNVLHMFRVSDKKLIELISLMGIIFAVCYLLQYVAFPKIIFNVRQGMDRGAIRIFLPGSSFMYTAYFISFQYVLYKKNMKHILLVLLYLTIVVFTGTRNTMAMVALVSFLGIIISKKVKSKHVLLLLFIGCGISVFFVFYEMFMGLIEMSFEQTDNAEEDVRAKATEFFLTTFMPNKACYILGNGMYHGAAAYGRQVMGYMALYGYYMGDIGFIGEYVKYGAIFVLGVLVSFIKWFSVKPSIKHTFIRYVLFFYVLSLFFGGGWAYEPSIVILCCMFYLLDISKINVEQSDSVSND